MKLHPYPLGILAFARKKSWECYATDMLLDDIMLSLQHLAFLVS